MDEIEELQMESLSIIEKTLRGQGRLDVNQRIRGIVGILIKEYQIPFDEILVDLICYVHRNRLLEKYDPEKGKLATYVTHCVYYALKAYIRRVKTIEDNPSEGRLGMSVDFLDDLGIEALVDYNNPEQMVIGRELLDLINDHFGADDAQVLLEMKERRDEAKRLGISYPAYCKRLQRKIAAFQPVLDQHS